MCYIKSIINRQLDILLTCTLLWICKNERMMNSKEKDNRLPQTTFFLNKKKNKNKNTTLIMVLA